MLSHMSRFSSPFEDAAYSISPMNWKVEDFPLVENLVSIMSQVSYPDRDWTLPIFSSSWLSSGKGCEGQASLGLTQEFTMNQAPVDLHKIYFLS